MLRRGEPSTCGNFLQFHIAYVCDAVQLENRRDDSKVWALRLIDGVAWRLRWGRAKFDLESFVSSKLFCIL